MKHKASYLLFILLFIATSCNNQENNQERINLQGIWASSIGGYAEFEIDSAEINVFMMSSMQDFITDSLYAGIGYSGWRNFHSYLFGSR